VENEKDHTTDNDV